MIQDIAPYQYKNEYKPVPPEANSILLCYDGRNVLVKCSSEGFSFPTFEEAEKCNPKEKLYGEYTYLFAIDDMRFYLGDGISCEALTQYTWEDIAIFKRTSPKYLGFAGITGWQLKRWYDSRRFCGRCGKPMVRDEKERMMRCPECGLMEYPKLCPATIVAVTHGNRILMTKYAGPGHTHYALIAGFAEIGETIEETVKREVMEEVGLKVKNLKFYKSQPWSFTDTLLFGFFCELDGDGEKVTIDKHELAMAQWFDRRDLPVEFDDCSLTNEMMIAFKENRWRAK